MKHNQVIGTEMIEHSNHETNRNHASRGLRRGAFSLIETTVSTLLVSILLVTSVSTIAHVNRVAGSENYTQRASQLARLFLSEITSKPFSTPLNTSPDLGRSSSETLPIRTNWDDCDDYDSLDLNGLTFADGTPIPDASDWDLIVTVSYSEPTDPFTGVSNVTDLKLIQLVLTDPAGTGHTFQALRSLYGPLQKEDFQDLLSSIEVSAETESGESMVASSRVLNQQGAP